jgi:NADH:ubiquinone oxidoreductase subunit 5 (subunit L)/multisubunit Na+/H+ antiporter MnhA subunit
VPASSLLLALSLVLPFAAALVVLAVGKLLGRWSGWLVVLAAVGSLACVCSVGSPAALDVAWLPAIGVRFALHADGFGLLLASLVAGIGALVALYALGYLGDEDAARVRRFWAALAAFMGSMLGIALADDLILLFVFWEMTSVASFLLIGFWFERDDAKAGALTALQVTALGGLAMVVGFLLIAQATGTFAISRIAGDRTLVATLLASPLATPALLLVLVGAFTKSAQVPFHFWLPRAMVAPTPVSAYLHAATMVKAGVFLLGRMHPIFGDAPAWAPTLVVVGAVSMALGAWQALRETDLKAILARTTASALGQMTLLYGLRATGEDGLQLLNHALYKGALFLVAGIVEHHAHTRRVDELGGLARTLPLTFVAGGLAALSMAGFPPLFGWVAKDAFYAQLLHAPYLVERPAMQGAVLLASFGTSACLVAIAGRLTIDVFLGPARPLPHPAHHGSGPPLWPAPLVLAAVALGFGVASAGEWPRRVVEATASAPNGPPHVALLPPLGGPLYASLAALALGIAAYRCRAALSRRRGIGLADAATVWDRAMDAIAWIADGYSRRWQNGSLRWYLAATTLTVPLLAFYARRALGLSLRDVVVELAQVPWYGLLFCGLLGWATIIAVTARTRLGAALATTAIGFVVSMLFVVYRSPDILLTQLLIETVSTIFVLLVLAFMPAFRPQDLSGWSRLVNLGVAGLFGATITLFVLLAMTPGLRETDNMATRPGGLLSLSLAEGGGQNAVNVIIVDIRAIDTTGEVTVLVVVGLCIYGLLRSRRAT